MESEKLVNTFKDFCSSGKFHALLILLLSSLLYHMVPKNNLTNFFDIFVSLFIVIFVVYLIVMALYITHKFNKGSERQGKKKYDNAIKYYDSVIRIHQNNRFIFPVLNLILGINPETVLKATTKIPTSTTYNKVMHKDNTLFEQSNSISAQEYSPYTYELDEYILRNTNIFTATYYNKGNSNAALKDYKEAIEAFDKAIAIDPKYATAYYSRGNSKALLKKDYNGAIEDYSKAIAIDPTDAYAYKNRGNSRTAIKDYEGALKDFDKAIELNPGHKHGL